MVHYRIAEELLTRAKKRAEANGIQLDVGEFPDHGQAPTENDDPQRIAKLAAHAIARVADRFTFLRKLSRHMEGTEKRAGLLSDLVAVTAAIYRRNPDAVEDLARQAATEMQTRRATQTATQNGTASSGQPKPGGIANVTP